MENLGHMLVCIWALTLWVIFISGIVLLIKSIRKKELKVVKKVFITSIIVALSSFVLYGVVTPVVRCNHEYTTTLYKPSTCTKDGKKELCCSFCGLTKKEIIKAEGHKMVSETVAQATYESEGQQIEVCSVCNCEVITILDKLTE